MAVNNIKLYEFLMDTENHIYFHPKYEEVRAWTWIPLYKLEDFTKVISESHFKDCGIDVKLFSDGIAIELNEIFEAEDEYLWEYRNWFEVHEINKYKDILLKEYEDNR